MKEKLLVLAGALALSAGVALAEDTSGKTGTEAGAQSGTVGLGAVGDMDRNKDGKVSLGELDESTQKLNADGQEAAFTGLSQEQVKQLIDECKEERIPPDEFKDTCERLGRLNM